MPYGSGLEKTAEQVFYHCERVHPFWNHVGEWTVVLADVGYVIDNFLPCIKLRNIWILAVAKTVIWTTQKKGLYNGANFSHRDQILFFWHQLRVKMRCDRKRLGCIEFDRRWVHAVSQVVRKRPTLESYFLPLSVHGDYSPGPSELYPG